MKSTIIFIKQRGVSVLAALLVVGVLSIAAAGINKLAPKEYSYANRVRLSATVSNASTPAPTAQDTKVQLNGCHDEMQYSGGQSIPTGKQICPCRQMQQSATEIVTNICLPGCTLYTHPGVDAGPSTVQTTGESKAFNKTSSIESLKGSCIIYACTGADKAACVKVNDSAIGSGINQKHIDAATTAGQIQNAESPAQRQKIYDSYTGDKTELDKVLGENQGESLPKAPTTDNQKGISDLSYLPIENPAMSCAGLDPAQCAQKPGGDMTTLNDNTRTDTYHKVPEVLVPLAKENDGAGACPGNPNCPGRTPEQTFQPGSTINASGGSTGGIMSGVGSFLTGLVKGMAGGQQSGQQSGQGSGSGSDNNQNCTPQYMCTNNSLIYQNTKCQKDTVQQCQNGCSGNTCATQPVAPYGYGTDGKACLQPVAQPAATECTAGAWQSIPASNGCAAAGWKCVASGTNGPLASISCLPLSADVGTTITVGFSCSNNATVSSGIGFNTGGVLLGTSTVSLVRPVVGSTTIIYTVGCTGGGVTTSAQCSVNANIPSITMVANPDHVGPNGISTIGWVTSGMQSCVVSSPEQPDFTMRNASYSSVNGVAATSPITQTTNIHLHCTTLNSGVRDATTTIAYFAN